MRLNHDYNLSITFIFSNLTPFSLYSTLNCVFITNIGYIERIYFNYQTNKIFTTHIVNKQL